jgi:23S rRNA pseudouridine955/2504/2580 synthase
VPSSAGKSTGAGAQTVRFCTIDEAADGQRLDNFLLTQLKGVPKSQVYRLVRTGEVRVNKGRAAIDYRLAPGDVVRIPPLRALGAEHAGTAAVPEPAAAEYALRYLGLLYEDDSIIAIDKPAGLAVHGGSGVSLGLIEALRACRPEARFLELVHRLDRDTSGVLLVAKKRRALTALHAMLRGEGPRVEKHYQCLVKGFWPHERRHVRLKLARSDAGRGRKVFADEESGQESHTIVERVECLPGATLLDCEIRTGRTHQIRVHLSTLGFPILGDERYGDFALNKFIAASRNGGLKRMFLHACSLRFAHPSTGESLRIEAPLPPELNRYLGFARNAGLKEGYGKAF